MLAVSGGDLSDISPEERKGLNAAMWTIIGLPLLIFVVSMVIWGIARALTW